MTRRSVWGWGAATIALGVGVSMMTSGPSTVQPQSFGGAPALTPTANTTPRDSLVGMVCIIYDDVKLVQWDSVRVLQPNRGGPGSAGGRTWDFPAGVSMEPWAILYGDTSANVMSKYKIQGLLRRGWDMGAQMYWEGLKYIPGNGSLLDGQTGAVARGNFNTTYPFEYSMAGCRRQSALDSIGIPYKPRWICSSNSGFTAFQIAIMSRLGYEFGFVPRQTATATSAQGTRSNVNWLMNMWQEVKHRNNALVPSDTTADGNEVAAVPGWNTSRYEICQTIGEQNSSIGTKRAIWSTIKNKGLCVINLHSALTWKSFLNNPGDTLGYAPSFVGTPGYAGAQGNLCSMSGVMSFIARYQRMGLLRVVTPSEAADWFYNRPISPGANWMDDNFRDVDRSIQATSATVNKPDHWLSYTTNSVLTAPTKALLGNSTAGGYGGHKYATMKWVTASRSTFSTRGTAKPWRQNNTTVWVQPPKGGGWTAHFEIFAIQDTTVASGTTANGDSLGVTYSALKASYWNNYSTGAIGFFPIAGAFNDPDAFSGTAIGEINASVRYGATGNTFGNVFKFDYANNVNTVGATRHTEWLHAVTDWEYPGDCDILLISVWHSGATSGTATGQVASGEIRLSNPHLSFFKNSPPAGN